MRSTTVAMAWCLAAVACGGRYDASGANPGASASNTGASNTGASNTGASSPGASNTGASSTGGSSPDAPGAAGAPTIGTAGNATMVGVAGTSAVDPGPPVGEVPPADCPDSPPLSKLHAPFAAPSVVWSRVAMLTWGKPVPPLSPLPPTTESGWAVELVDPALKGALATLGSAPGVEIYLRQALGLDPAAAFQMAWGKLVATNQPLPELLLTVPLGGSGRIGIYTEPSWLALHPNISSRGAGIYRSLFGLDVPAPPPNTSNIQLDPGLPDRVALQQSLVNPACAACHQLTDQPGFALGHFAANGNYRDQDHGLPIDATGSLEASPLQIKGTFDGIEDFGRNVVGSCATTYGIADAFLHAALVINKAPEAVQQTLFEASQGQVRQSFRAEQRSYAALLRAYLRSPAGLYP